jgi:hypothetical protein
MLRHACGYKLANDGHDTRAIPLRRTSITTAAMSALGHKRTSQRAKMYYSEPASYFL